jgi:uncharacterized membrane protein YgcG
MEIISWIVTVLIVANVIATLVLLSGKRSRKQKWIFGALIWCLPFIGVLACLVASSEKHDDIKRVKRDPVKPEDAAASGYQPVNVNPEYFGMPLPSAQLVLGAQDAGAAQHVGMVPAGAGHGHAGHAGAGYENAGHDAGAGHHGHGGHGGGDFSGGGAGGDSGGAGSH